MATMADHRSGMAHEGTTSTKTHEGEWWGAGRYREPAARARAGVVSGEIIGAAIEVHRQLGPGLQVLTYLRLSGRWMGLLLNFNTDRIKHGLRRLLNG